MTAAPRRSDWGDQPKAARRAPFAAVKVVIEPGELPAKQRRDMLDAVCHLLGVRRQDIYYRSRSTSAAANRIMARRRLAAKLLNELGYGTPDIATVMGMGSHRSSLEMVESVPDTDATRNLVSMMWTLIREGWMHGAEQAVEAAEFDIHRKGK